MKLPALDVDGTVIPQSLVIIEYLEEIQPVPQQSIIEYLAVRLP